MTLILLVEDDEMNRDVLSRRLLRRGFEVVIATDGVQALATAEAATPDLILLDVSLPLLDGLEVARRLRAGTTTASIPIIALTAHAMQSDREQALSAGCDEFETKPTDLPRLLAKIDAALGRRA